MKLGTWTTIDCPTKEQDKAYEYLLKEFEAIGGTVRQLVNYHDLGAYPSFEIDRPERFEAVDMIEDYPDDNTEENQLLAEYEEWYDKANEIEERYSKEFEKYL